MMRLFWTILGIAAVGLGIVGIVLPLLPTVPFLLLAAWCFARSSERLHLWLTRHPRLGPPISDWHNSGAIAPRIKKMASISMLAVFAISMLAGVSVAIIAVQAVALTGAAIFILTRPDS